MYTLPFQRIQIKLKQSFHFFGGGGGIIQREIELEKLNKRQQRDAASLISFTTHVPHNT